MKILVVDDDRQMVKTICDILKVKGYETLTAYTGVEAVAQLSSEEPDCVLMDINMQGAQGAPALKGIRALSPHIPVVFMSAYATEEQVAEAKAQGAYTVMNKPIDIESVLFFLSLLKKEQSVLIVDDDALFCKTLKDILQNRGYAVETERDPEKVLGHLERSYQLVVLLDLNLGGASGLGVLKDIRKHYPTKPVVLLTGYGGSMAGSIMKGHEIGVYSCLYKPFEAEALIETIREIGRKKLRSVLGESFEDDPPAALFSNL